MHTQPTELDNLTEVDHNARDTKNSSLSEFLPKNGHNDLGGGVGL